MSQGWKRTHFPQRPTHNFPVPPAIKEFITEVASNRDASELVLAKLRDAPKGRTFVLVVHGPSIMGAVLYFVIALGGTLPITLAVDEPWKQLLLGLPVILVAGSVLLYFFSVASRALGRYADVLVMSQLITVIEAANTVTLDPTSVDARANLAKTVRSSAKHFEKTYPVRTNGIDRASRRELNRQARRCAKVLNSYTVPALSGDAQTISTLKSDFARAVLRVGTGNWIQVGHLAPQRLENNRFVGLLSRNRTALALIGSVIVVPVLAELLSRVIAR